MVLLRYALSIGIAHSTLIYWYSIITRATQFDFRVKIFYAHEHEHSDIP
jgi:hypothetical protein